MIAACVFDGSVGAGVLVINRRSASVQELYPVGASNGSTRCMIRSFQLLTEVSGGGITLEVRFQSLFPDFHKFLVGWL